jgi:hypothetical protein
LEPHLLLVEQVTGLGFAHRNPRYGYQGCGGYYANSSSPQRRADSPHLIVT